MALHKNDIIGKKYRIINKIGSGSFGDVYKGKNVRTGELVAIKVESLSSNSQLLKGEARIARFISNHKGFAAVKWYGVDTENTYAVFELLGSSLDIYMSRLGKFSLRTTLLLGIQMIERLQVLHENGIIHRDIKPDNFMLGHSNPDTLYMIDFGLAKCYLREGQHIPPKEKKKITGTIRYASLNLHEGYEPSRRDDLISVGYMMIYFLKGRLPWQGLNASTKEERHQMIWDVKQDTSLEDLCHGLPDALMDYMRDCYRLGFTDKPEYTRLIYGLKNVLKKVYLEHEKIIFDWSIEDSNTIYLIDFCY